MKKTITTQQLHTLRKGSEGFLLIDVLGKDVYAKDHIPGAHNVPLDSADFAKAVADKAAGSRCKKVVIYSAGPGCDAAAKASRLLVEGGFSNIVEYEGGIAAWNVAKSARLASNAKTGS